MDKILDTVWQSGFQITKLKMVQLDGAEANEFYKDYINDRNYKYLFQISVSFHLIYNCARVFVLCV